MKQRFSTHKDLQKKIVENQWEKLIAVFKNKPDVSIASIKQTFAVQLLANTAVFLHCYIILNMPSIFAFRILQTTWSILL